jgi:hypothetical protein
LLADCVSVGRVDRSVLPAGQPLIDPAEPADDHDQFAEQLQHTDTRWSLELDNP